MAEELDATVDRSALDHWAGLLCAIVARGEADAARAWLCRRNVDVVRSGPFIVAATRLAYDRIKQIFGALLAEQGWRVVMSGAGG